MGGVGMRNEGYSIFESAEREVVIVRERVFFRVCDKSGKNMLPDIRKARSRWVC